MNRTEWLASLARRHTSGALLLTDADGRVLMVEPAYKDDWTIPGGSTEAGETPVQACRREVVEEIGLALPVGRLLVLEHQTIEGDDSTHFVYDGGVLPSDAVVVLPPDELLSWRFVAAGDLETLTTPRMATRLRAALQARADGTVVELENGVAHR